MVRKDYTLPILVIGGFIFMIGLVQGSYWTHRRIWIQEENGKVMVAGHTNKNWYAFKREMAEVAKEAELEQPVDRTEDK
ncbi:cytochrome c biogenesis protein ResB [Alkalihalobacillus alcalophilus]|uniref:cytochrome c biogenesis protein ResB n=1 Tax=Alkalihalobacillus alcalophilus TaxID=1445 RepID=UPI001F34378F|nr:cytochrome c biogenesis protein ResB [Alkalihalobacillus alcalophilus]